MKKAKVTKSYKDKLKGQDQKSYMEKLQGQNKKTKGTKKLKGQDWKS